MPMRRVSRARSASLWLTSTFLAACSGNASPTNQSPAIAGNAPVAIAGSATTGASSGSSSGGALVGETGGVGTGGRLATNPGLGGTPSAAGGPPAGASGATEGTEAGAPAIGGTADGGASGSGVGGAGAGGDYCVPGANGGLCAGGSAGIGGAGGKGVAGAGGAWVAPPFNTCGYPEGVRGPDPDAAPRYAIGSRVWSGVVPLTQYSSYPPRFLAEAIQDNILAPDDDPSLHDPMSGSLSRMYYAGWVVLNCDHSCNCSIGCNAPYWQEQADLNGTNWTADLTVGSEASACDWPIAPDYNCNGGLPWLCKCAQNPDSYSVWTCVGGANCRTEAPGDPSSAAWMRGPRCKY